MRQIEIDTTLDAGIHTEPIQITNSQLTLNGNGGMLVGASYEGTGLLIENCQQVTIKNLRIVGFRHGIVARNCRQIAIENCHISATSEMPANREFLNIWLPAEQAYGGAIFLQNVSDSMIEGNELSHQMCGLLAYHSQRLTIRGNVANYCSAAGFHLHDVCDSLLEENYADFCCRYQPRIDGTGHMGADAAGFVMVMDSCRNRFLGNRARLGGDGFFVAGMTPQFERHGCDDNLFEGNDGSYSPNIAFEATFCQGNIFRNNKANQCNYGFWLGFSSQGEIAGNEMKENRQAGIAVENGVDFDVYDNRFIRNRHGILLWSKHIPEFLPAVPGNATSANWRIRQNIFRGNWKGIRIAPDQDHGIVKFEPPASPLGNHDIAGNKMGRNQIDFDIA